MAYKYYKLTENEVIETVTTIPENMLERKGLLPYEEIIISEDSITNKKKTEFIKVLSDKVVNTITRYSKIPTLDETKSSSVDNIKEEYYTTMREGYTCSNGIKLDCRESDKINWMYLKLKCKDDSKITVKIKDFDNVVHDDITVAEALTMISEIENHYDAMLYNKWDKEKEVFDCIDKDEINLIKSA